MSREKVQGRLGGGERGEEYPLAGTGVGIVLVLDF